MENKNYNYETKCRRCGNLTEWHFSTVDRFTWMQFADAMQDHIEHPRQSKCDTCKKDTVQDVVAYSPVGGCPSFEILINN